MIMLEIHEIFVSNIIDMLYECALYSSCVKQTGSIRMRTPSIYKLAFTGVNQLYDSLAQTKPGTPYSNKNCSSYKWQDTTPAAHTNSINSYFIAQLHSP